MRLLPGRTYSFFLVKEFVKVLIVCVLFIMSLSYIVRSLQKSGSGRNLGFVETVYVYILDAPEILLREALLPSCMFAAVYSMSNLTKNREILALRSCGVSVYRIITPLILIGCAISVFALFAEDELLIRSKTAKDAFVARLKGEGEKSYLRDRANVTVFGENGAIYKIDRYMYKSLEMSGVVILRKDEGGNIVELSSATKAVWDGKEWVLEKGVLFRFGEKGDLRERRVFSKHSTGMRDDPRYFSRDTRRIENMTLREGREFVEMNRKMGLPYKGMLTKYHKKIAGPVSLLFIIVIGLSLGSTAFRNALVVSFSITLGFVLVFFFIVEIGHTFGSNGAVPPVLGGWLGNILYLPLSVFLLQRLRV